MRISTKTKDEARRFISAYYNAIGDNTPNLGEHLTEIYELTRRARAYNKLQEAACNYELSATQLKHEKNHEKHISAIARSIGLEATFDGDPRGYCVKLHHPTQKLHNTWGGPEAGYGIGENS